MSDLRYLLFFFLAFCGTVSCQKIDGPAGNVFQTWEVKDFVAIDENRSSDDTVSIYFSISEDNTYTLQLEKNTCTGSILNITDKYIVLNAPGCTEICCDNEFAIRFKELIPSISMYKISEDMLRLYVDDWGFIECELVD